MTSRTPAESGLGPGKQCNSKRNLSAAWPFIDSQVRCIRELHYNSICTASLHLFHLSPPSPAAAMKQAPVGSAQWIFNEKDFANRFVQQEVDDFIFSAHNELEWLNEHMAEVFHRTEL